MNRWRLFRNSCIALALAAGVLRAAPPVPPYQPAPPGTEWTIKVTALQPDAAGLTEIRGRRTATLRHEVVKWRDRETERWLARNFALETVLDRAEVIATPYPKNSRLVEKRLAEFPELDWLSSANQHGTAEIGGKKCRYYDTRFVVKPEVDGELLRAVREGRTEMPKDIIYTYKAWIDAETNLPVAYESQDYRYEYSFSRSPDLTLSLPDSFLQAARQLDPSFTP